MNRMGNSLPPYPVMTLVPRPVNEKGLAFNLVELHKSPVPAVHAVVAVIPHDKIGVLGNGDRSKIIPGLSLSGIDDKILMNGIGLVQRFLIHIHLFIKDLHHIPRLPNDPFNEVLTFILRIFENDHVSSFRLAERNQDLIRKGNLDPVDKLIDQDMIPNVQSLDHRTGGNFKGLNHKGPNEERQDNRNDQRLGILSECGFLLDRGKDYSSTFKMARKASCGISTRPTCFIRFLPSFCFSHNFLFRVMSPP